MPILVLIGLLVAGGLLVASFFVRRYRETERPQTGWRATDELFNDPSTNRLMRVWLDAGGGRHYVAEAKKA
jgi:hypothetical protein